MPTDRLSIAYVIHIAATPEKLWQALTSRDALEKNWGRIESSWTAGAEVKKQDDSGKVLWNGEVLHSEPPRLLAFTFDVIGSREPPSTVKFELSPPDSRVAQNAPVVRLTLTQVGFQQDSKIFSG